MGGRPNQGESRIHRVAKITIVVVPDTGGQLPVMGKVPYILNKNIAVFAIILGQENKRCIADIDQTRSWEYWQTGRWIYAKVFFFLGFIDFTIVIPRADEDFMIIKAAVSAGDIAPVVALINFRIAYDTVWKGRKGRGGRE